MSKKIIDFIERFGSCACYSLKKNIGTSFSREISFNLLEQNRMHWVVCSWKEKVDCNYWVIRCYHDKEANKFKRVWDPWVWLERLVIDFCLENCLEMYLSSLIPVHLLTFFLCHWVSLVGYVLSICHFVPFYLYVCHLKHCLSG